MKILAVALLILPLSTQAEPNYSFDCKAEKRKAEAALKMLLDPTLEQGLKLDFLTQTIQTLEIKSSPTETDNADFYASHPTLFHRAAITCYGLTYQAKEEKLTPVQPAKKSFFSFDFFGNSGPKSPTPRYTHLSDYDRTNSLLFLAMTLLDEKLLPKGVDRFELHTNDFKKRLPTLVKYQDTFEPQHKDTTIGIYDDLFKTYNFRPNQLTDNHYFMDPASPETLTHHTCSGRTPHNACPPGIPVGIQYALHEYAHGLDDALKPDLMFITRWFSSSPRWEEQLQGVLHPSRYAGTNPREAFAENFTAYLLMPDYRCNNPKLYAFFAKNFPVNPEVYGSTRPFVFNRCQTE